MLFPKFFIFISFSLLSAQTVPSLSYAELKPLLNQSDDKVHVVNFGLHGVRHVLRNSPILKH